MSIPNYGGQLPTKYKNDSGGDIKQLGIKKLFRMILVGPSNSGKNNTIFHILKSSPNCFSHLHIIARNEDQELYNYLRDKLKGFITFWPSDNIPTVDTIRKSDDPKAIELVIIDDYANDMNLQKSVFSHYFTRGRHKNLSSVFLTQSYYQGCFKLIRVNSEYVGVLRANSRRDLDLILSDFNIPMSKEQFYNAYRKATEQKGQLLFVDSINSHIRSNFDKVFDNETLELKSIKNVSSIKSEN